MATATPAAVTCQFIRGGTDTPTQPAVVFAVANDIVVVPATASRLTAIVVTITLSTGLIQAGSDSAFSPSTAGDGALADCLFLQFSSLDYM